MDPLRHIDHYLALSTEHGLTVERVLDTHGHADHISGGPALANTLDIPYQLHPYDGIHPIVPGNLDDSELYLRITSDDKKERMPPAKFGKSLNAREIALIKKWIEQGAKWQGHWAYLPAKRTAAPKVKQSSWIANPIDGYILARLELYRKGRPFRTPPPSR